MQVSEGQHRFSAALDALGIGPQDALGLAVSGGPDSLALLLIAAKSGRRVAAATVDHGLRLESSAEAAGVAQLCQDIGVPHMVLRPAEPITGSVQAAARTARYALLEQWRVGERLDWIATAHHADDQLETMLMRLLRGSGVGGMAGVRARNGHVIRPLLDWTRAELGAVVAEAGLTAVDDPSNHLERFDRVRLRNQLATLGLSPRAAARTAGALAQADDALTWAATREWDARASRDGEAIILDVADLPAELSRRLLLRAIETLEPGAIPRGDALMAALATLTQGGKAMLGALLIQSSGPDAMTWRIAPAPPRRH